MSSSGEIVVIGGEKGGTGKTMLATNLAVCHVKRGRRVKLIDADAQASASRWATKRGELKLEPYIPCAILRDAVFHGVREEAKHYDLVIVDAGGADSIEFETACAAAQRLLSPIAPSDCDIGTIETIDALVARLVGSGQQLDARIVLNLVSTHVADDEESEARAELERFRNLRIASSIVHTRKPFRAAYKRRLSVVESADVTRFGKSAAEIWAIYEEFWG
jgi:chromosome partitioning protein